MSAKQKVGFGISIGFGLIILGYTFFQLHDFIFGSRFVIEDISDGMVVYDPHIIVHGKAEKASYLAFNGDELLVSADDTFSTSYLLLPGINVLSLDMQDRFGHKKHKQFTITYLQLSN